MANVVFRPAAENDLAEIYRYIAENSGLERAGAYLDRIEKACMALSNFPLRGTQRNDLYPGLRITGFEHRASIAFTVEQERWSKIPFAYCAFSMVAGISRRTGRTDDRCYR
ncbi:type II toxin-antitoxin system RelE/ParE family toxin [Rhizobium sp. Root482]|uniref:type II toxin-antitoxin system RelE/ParE family toxin n=1 Tax=Rhizobium sp. Root482 TaxID=1736543 RepID=UPI000A63CA59|nr:type II toxin-antitoxin system RelE/ParE family toxin [Rhizobium sp. Root482]